MPKNATDAVRIAWHRLHAEHCACRPIPERVQELMRQAPAAGYSGKSLADKLGIKPGLKLRLLDAPAHIVERVPPGVQIQRSANTATDLVHLFATSQAQLQKELTSLRAKLRPDAVVWVSWPKKTAKVATDVTEDSIRAAALPLGWVDIKVCAVDATWSALKLVVRKELR